MSDFTVTIHRIETIKPHENADKLEIATINGIAYQFVVGKGNLAAGQLVAYFPVDSLIPEPLAQLLDLPVKGEGKPYRVKSIRLRGVWSEGVLASMSVLTLDEKFVFLDMDLTAALGVSKYEKPEFNGKDFQSRPDSLIALPVTVHRYDIENLQRFPEVYEALRGQVVVVTEKLEGSHWWARIDKDGETIHVGQRNYEIRRETPEEPALSNEDLHPWWKALYDEHYDQVLAWLAREYRGYDVTIRGEIIGDGIQGNYYGLPPRERRVYLFEIEINGEPVDAEVFLDLTRPELHVRRVPVLYRWNTLEELGGDVQAVIDLANGRSAIADTKLREGIVIKPITEQYNPLIGRLFIKIRDAEYLSKDS